MCAVCFRRRKEDVRTALYSLASHFPYFPPFPQEYIQASCGIVYQILCRIGFQARWTEQKPSRPLGEQGSIWRDKAQNGEDAPGPDQCTVLRKGRQAPTSWAAIQGEPPSVQWVGRETG